MGNGNSPLKSQKWVSIMECNRKFRFIINYLVHLLKVINHAKEGPVIYQVFLLSLNNTQMYPNGYISDEI